MFVCTAAITVVMSSCSKKEICYVCSEAYDYNGSSVAANSNFCVPEEPSSDEAAELVARGMACATAGGSWTVK